MLCECFIRFSHNSVRRARWVAGLQACVFTVLSVLWTLLDVHHCIVLLIHCIISFTANVRSLYIFTLAVLFNWNIVALFIILIVILNSERNSGY